MNESENQGQFQFVLCPIKCVSSTVTVGTEAVIKSSRASPRLEIELV